jgi:integrase
MIPHTHHHAGCACNQRSLVRSEEKLADQLFPAAFEMWLAARLVGDSEETSVRYIAETSEDTYREYAWALEKFFRGFKLNEIHDGHIRQYQDDRAICRGGWKKKCGQNRIKKETGMLIRMLRAAHLWSDDLDDAFDQLPTKYSDVPRAMDPEQQAHWLSSCLWDEDWHWVYHYCVLALQTCASTFEMRKGRLVDINTRHWTFRVGPEASKNKFRNRTIPLESDAVRESAEFLLRRAYNQFGCRNPEHFILPFGGGSRRGDLDITRPMTKDGLKDTWGKIRVKSTIRWVRAYDLRHTAITRMAENGTPISTIMAFAGQMSPRMQQHYTTISMQAKKDAAQQVWVRKPPTSVRLLLPQYASA